MMSALCRRASRYVFFRNVSQLSPTPLYTFGSFAATANNGNGNGDPWRKWKDLYHFSDDINPFITIIESLAKSQQRGDLERVLIDKAKLPHSRAILLTQDLIDTFGESQGIVFIIHTFMFFNTYLYSGTLNNVTIHD